MAGRISPFLTGCVCEIRVGNKTVMFGQNLTYQDSMQTFQPFGLGDYSSKHNEPLFYPGGSITMSIQRYTDAIFALDGATLSGNTVQATVDQGTNRVVSSEFKQATDGNSLASVNFMSPAVLIFERSVDIIIYAKHNAGTGEVNSTPIYKAIDCLLQNYSTGHNAASPTSEQYTFRCRLLQSVQQEPDKQQNNA